MLTDKDNFGYHAWSILKFAGFSNAGSAAGSNMVTSPNTWTDDGRSIIGLNTTAWNSNMSETRLQRLLYGLDGRPPVDIVMIGYSTEYFLNSSATARNTVLANWCKQGGILIICSEEETSNGYFLRLFFNEPSIGSAVIPSSPGYVYTLGFNPDNTDHSMRAYYCRDDDPILRGPFHDILGRVWGEDASNTRYVINLPLDSVIIYSGANQIGYNDPARRTGVTIFRHRDYPLVFIGDGGFNSSEVRSYWNTPGNVCPFTLTTRTIAGHEYNYYPSHRSNFGASRSTVYNTAFTANAFAWCIMKAEEIRRASRH